MKIAIIGGGILGLSAAYHLQKKGAQVTVFEKESFLGGLASSFPINHNTAVEKYHHFVNKGDNHLLQLLEELNLTDEVEWRDTTLGYYMQHHIHPFNGPIDLFKIPHASFIDKLRFGFAVNHIKSIKKWQTLDGISAKKWLIQHMGQRAYQLFWEHLMTCKFTPYVDDIPMAWLWARLNRRLTDKKIFNSSEQFGYMKNSFSILIDTLEKSIIQSGGIIHTQCPIKKIHLNNSALHSIESTAGAHQCDAVVVTIPLPYFIDVLPPTALWTSSLKSIDYASILNVIIVLKNSFNPHFWLNISEKEILFPGIIEFTHLRPPETMGNNHYLYFPNYMHRTNPLFTLPDEKIIEIHIQNLRTMNPSFDTQQIVSTHVFRDMYADPYYKLNYCSIMPEHTTPIKGLYISNTSQIYPITRSVNNSIFFGKKIADIISPHGQELSV